MRTMGDPAGVRSRFSTLRGWRLSQWSTGPRVCSARFELATSAFGERCSSWLSYEHVRPEGFEPSSTALEVRLPSSRRGRESTWGRTRTCGEMLNRHLRCRFATHVESPPPESNRVSAVYKTAASPAMLDGHVRGLGARCDVDRDAPGRIRISNQQAKNLFQ
jgi:hypothetical protein